MKKVFRRENLFYIVMLLILSLGIILMVTAETTAVHAEDVDVLNDTEIVTVIEGNTFFGNVWNWIVAHKTLLFTIGSYAANLAVLIKKFVGNDKRLKNLEDASKATDDNVVKNLIKQNEIVEITNKLISAYNTTVSQVEGLNKTVKSITELFEPLLQTVKEEKSQMAAVLYILTTVYQNSKNVPQGVKDLINLSYAKTLEITNSGDLLKGFLPVDSEKEGGEINEGDNEG